MCGNGNIDNTRNRTTGQKPFRRIHHGSPLVGNRKSIEAVILSFVRQHVQNIQVVSFQKSRIIYTEVSARQKFHFVISNSGTIYFQRKINRIHAPFIARPRKRQVGRLVISDYRRIRPYGTMREIRNGHILFATTDHSRQRNRFLDFICRERDTGRIKTAMPFPEPFLTRCLFPIEFFSKIGISQKGIFLGAHITHPGNFFSVTRRRGNLLIQAKSLARFFIAE